MGDNFDAKFLREKASELRCNIIKMITIAGSGHPGGSLSAIDIITYLYYYRMRINPKDPDWEDRDRFILSKGHCAPAQYVALADRGYFPVEELWTLRDIGSILQGHPDMKKTPGIEMTTGSLGQGLSCGVGIALGGKLDQRDYKVYVMLGDGEIQSGQVWEAAMAASHYKLDNLVGIVDYNQFQCDGATNEIMSIEPVKKRWESFGWNVFEIDGHDFDEIHEAFEKCMLSREKPSLIIAHTVKGKGVSFMEGNHIWHGTPTNSEEAAEAIREIRGGRV